MRPFIILIFILSLVSESSFPQFASTRTQEIDTIKASTQDDVTIDDSLIINETLVVSGQTTLDTSLNGFAKLVSGIVSAQALIDLTADVAGVLPIANGGTGSSTQNFVDLTTAQTIGGLKTFTDEVYFQGPISSDITTDSSSTGANVELSLPTTDVVRLTNASLASIEMIVAPTRAQKLVLVNHTGSEISILNETGATSANQILTGTSNNISMSDQASLYFLYDVTETKWLVVGGSGSSSPTTTEGDLIYNDGGGNGSDARLAIGTAGQILTVDSGLPSWQDAPVSTTLTAKGDLQTHDGTANATQTVGNDGEVLYSDSTTTNGLAWKNPISGISQAHWIGRLEYDKSSGGDADCAHTPSVANNWSVPDQTNCNALGVIDPESTFTFNTDNTMPSIDLEVKAGTRYKVTVVDSIYKLASAAGINCESGISVDGGVTTVSTRTLSEDPTDSDLVRLKSESSYSFTANSTQTINVQYMVRTNTSSACEFMNRLDNFSLEVYAFPNANSAAATQETGLTDVYAHSNGNTELTADVTNIDFSTEVRDTFNEWNGSEFTARKNSKFSFKGYISLDTSITSAVELYVDTGAGYQLKTRCSGVLNTSTHHFDCDYKLNQNDKAALRLSASEGLNDVNEPEARHNISITEVESEPVFLATLEQTNITKDEDKYSESEVEWGFWNGAQLYRRCFTVGSDITTSSTITTWASGLDIKNATMDNNDRFIIQSHTDTSTNTSVIRYVKSSGVIEAAIGGSYEVRAETSFCLEYTK